MHRRVDADDRRNRVVELTDAGRDALAACRRDIRAGESAVLAPLDPAAAAALTEALDRVARPLRGTVTPPP